MRIPFRKFLIGQSKRDRILFFAPIAIALVLLLLYTQNKVAFAAAWHSPLAMLRDRSPGNRDAGALYSIKPERPVASVMAGPRERVLAGIRERPSLADLLSPESPSLGLPINEPLLFGTSDLPGLGLSPVLGTPGLPGRLGSNLPNTPTFFIPGLAPVPDTPTVPTPELPPVTDTPILNPPLIPSTPPPACCDDESAVSPVPEPTTWAMYVLGQFIIGGALRYRNRKRRASPLPLQG